MMSESIVPASLRQFDAETRREADTTTKSDELGQDEFLKLMLAQVKHQDPMEPMDNGEFISELAEFSTVTGIDEMNASLAALTEAYGSAQTLSSAQLVGREVLVETDRIELQDGESAGGRFELEHASGAVTAIISDAGGQQVRELPLGSLGPGRHDFDWNGHDNRGTPLPAGLYTVAIQAASGEEQIAIPMLGARRVDSVEFGAGGETRLQDTSGETFTLDAVRQIRQERNSANKTSGTDA